jgi:hypothetical protein
LGDADWYQFGDRGDVVGLDQRPGASVGRNWNYKATELQNCRLGRQIFYRQLE